MSASPCSDSPSAEYISAEKLATLFDPPLSIGFIRKLQARRVIPFTRIGRRVVFCVPAVRAALEAKYTVFPRGGAPRSAA